jgi:hypothetical protein
VSEGVVPAFDSLILAFRSKHDPVGNRTNSNQNGLSAFNQTDQLLSADRGVRKRVLRAQPEELSELLSHLPRALASDLAEVFCQIAGRQDLPESVWQIACCNFAEAFCAIVVDDAVTLHSQLVPLRPAALDQKSRRTLLLRNRGHAVRLVSPGTQASVKFRPIRASRAQP